MKRSMIHLLLVALLPLSISCGTKAEQEGTKSTSNIAKNIDVASFKAMIDTNKQAIILDVRTKPEFESGHLAKANNIDWNSSSFNAQVEKLDKNAVLLIYCRSGARSSAAMKRMVSLGFKEIYNMQGGIMAWTAKSYSVEK